MSHSHVVGQASPEQFVSQLKTILRFTTDATFADGIWRHIETCCAVRTRTDAVGIIFRKETPNVDGQVLIEIIGGAILLLVSSQKEYFFEKATKNNNNNNKMLDRAVLTRIWIPWLSFFAFFRYGSDHCLAHHIAFNAMALINNIRFKSGLGATLTGVDLRTPPTTHVRAAFREFA